MSAETAQAPRSRHLEPLATRGRWLATESWKDAYLAGFQHRGSYLNGFLDYQKSSSGTLARKADFIFHKGVNPFPPEVERKGRGAVACSHLVCGPQGWWGRKHLCGSIVKSLHLQELPQCPVTEIPLNLINTVNFQSPLISVEFQGRGHMSGH